MKEIKEADGVKSEIPVQSANERWKAGIMSKNPNKEFASEDDYYEASMSGYDAEHERVKAMIASNTELAKRMEQDPQAASAIADFLGGAPLPAALKKYFTDEDLQMVEGENGYESYLEAIKDRDEKRMQSQKAHDERQANLAQSGEDIDKFAADRGMSEDEVMDFLRRLEDEIIKPLSAFKLDYNFLEKAEKFLNFDSEVASREDIAYKKGKNEKIVESRRSVMDDGLPQLGGGGAAAEKATTNPTAKAFDSMIGAASERDIFEKGGFKRVGRKNG